MKTPEEIKKGLAICYEDIDCSECPYLADCFDDDEAPYGAVMPDALTLIQQLESQVPKWISVEERLPEIYETVIIWRSDYYEASIGWYFQPGWSVPKGVEVTHWMPLPEPPKEAEYADN